MQNPDADCVAVTLTHGFGGTTTDTVTANGTAIETFDRVAA
jgi:hypothetical protein